MLGLVYQRQVYQLVALLRNWRETYALGLLKSSRAEHFGTTILRTEQSFHYCLAPWVSLIRYRSKPKRHEGSTLYKV